MSGLFYWVFGYIIGSGSGRRRAEKKIYYNYTPSYTHIDSNKLLKNNQLDYRYNR